MTGCAPSPTSFQKAEDSASSEIFSVDSSNPWAQEFAAAFGRAKSSFERKILADGKITEAEFAEVKTHYLECMKANGVSSVTFRSDGGIDFKIPSGLTSDRMNDIDIACTESSGQGTVGSLFNWIRRNPMNQDESEIMVHCLIEEGVVDPSYSASKYSADLVKQSFPFTDPVAGSAALSKCSSDPLGALGR